METKKAQGTKHLTSFNAFGEFSIMDIERQQEQCISFCIHIAPAFERHSYAVQCAVN